MSKWATPKGHCGNPFGPISIDDYLPTYDEIPSEFMQMFMNPWCKIVMDWFYDGLTKLEARPKEGIDAEQAFGHLSACLGSWEPQHERKISGIAYLMSLWFDEIRYEKGNPTK